MTKRHYAEKHKKSGICNHIQAVGNVASHNKAVVVSDARRVKISDVPIVCDEHSLVKRYNKKAKLVSVDVVTKQVTLYSIAHRSLILAELWKPIEIDSVGIRKVQIALIERVSVELMGTGMWRMEDRQYAIRVEEYKMYDETEFGKWTKVDTGKYIPTVPKKKLRIITHKKKLVLEEPVCEKCHLIECCCEADRLQVIADDARARAEGLVEVDGRWVKQPKKKDDRRAILPPKKRTAPMAFNFSVSMNPQLRQVLGGEKNMEGLLLEALNEKK
jgi:hypothetical protein